MTALPYTLVFLRRDDQILMLKRLNPPNKGLWNGLGGHLEPGESAMACAQREVWEETGIFPERLELRAEVLWHGDTLANGGMYVFLGDVSELIITNSPEGMLEWKNLDWVLASPDEVTNIPVFLPHILNRSPRKRFYFEYAGNLIQSWRFELLGGV